MKHPPRQKYLKGLLSLNPKGFGFVRLDTDAPDVFIAPENLSGAMADDTVLVEITDTRSALGPSGIIRQVLKRGHEDFVACLAFADDGYVLRPLRRELPVTIALYPKNHLPDNVSEGDWVLCKLNESKKTGAPITASISKPLESSGTVTHDLNAISLEYDLPKKFSTSDNTRFAPTTPVQVPREDCTDLTAVTIDPTDAKDYDDALSYQTIRGKKQAIIGVHIADVACFIPPDSKLDYLARERMFSCYLPGRTIPMLPPVLSNDACSLNAGENRLAHSVFLTVDLKTGEILATRRAHTLIRVTRRLTHEEASRVIDGEKSDLPRAIVTLIKHLAQANTAIRENRAKNECFLPITVPAFRVLCGGRPVRVQGVVPEEATSASLLVEDFMLAANTAVAHELLERGIPALFRNHAEPEEESLDTFSAIVSSVLQRKRTSVDLSTRRRIVRFLTSLAHEGVSGALLSFAFLRCLPRACYGDECDGHYGLGKMEYCHFTSPIRRYPDLLVHQQLLAWDTGKKLRSRQFVAEQMMQVNEQEQAIDQATIAALDRLKMRYVQDKFTQNRQQAYEAFVMRAHTDGLQVYLPEVGLMGTMDKKDLGDERWFFDKRTRALVNRTGQAYQCGNVIYVTIRSIDPIHGDIKLRPAQMMY